MTGIRLYRDGERVQALETESTGSCGIFTPEIVDMDFDGWPDIAIAQFLPAGPNIPMDAWLYDPATGRFARAPASLLQVTTPNFDAARRLVWHTWRDGCCRHGVDIFRWRDGELEHVDGDESYMMPVRVDGELRGCYVAPDYADGRIVWQGALRDVAGRPTLDPDVAAHCTPTTPEGMLDPSRIRIDVWQEAAPGSAPIRIRSETARTVQGVVGDTTRTCTELPVFDEGTIGWLPLAGDGCASHDDP
ncbi:XAC2610-related protein [Coralloluteibacterium thermophilus]|uniref:XAC2610-related protein n=1 Tax=Coralloluteibacterium thermophilum TaxID=2707049 RepID=A0ABV9NRX5_9GAMM